MWSWPRDFSLPPVMRKRADVNDDIRKRLTEIEALSKLLGNDDVAALWHRVAQLFEGGHEMEVMIAAYQDLLASDLIRDKSMLDSDSFSGQVPVYLCHDQWGGFHIDVLLHGLEAGQITFVLDVARRHELEAREDGGSLRLSPHLTSADVEDGDREPEAVEA